MKPKEKTIGKSAFSTEWNCDCGWEHIKIFHFLEFNSYCEGCEGPCYKGDLIGISRKASNKPDEIYCLDCTKQSLRNMEKQILDPENQNSSEVEE